MNSNELVLASLPGSKSKTTVQKMRLKSIVLDALLLILTVPAVILIFRMVPDRKVAATFAGLLFVLVPVAMMVHRWKNPLPTRSANAVWWVGVLQFWLLFSLPILGSRLLFWETPFEQFTFFGFSGTQWHEFSSKSYTMMCVFVLLSGMPKRK